MMLRLLRRRCLHTECVVDPDQVSGGKHVFILHGLFGAGQNWRSPARWLAKCSSSSVTLVDLRHHGKSEHDGTSFDYDALAEDVERLIDERIVAGDIRDRVSVVGHSMGGKVAMRLALEREELIDKLVVVDIAPVAYAKSGTGSVDNHAEFARRMRGIDLTGGATRSSVSAQLRDSVADDRTRQFLMTNLVVGDDKSLRWRVNLDAIVASYDALRRFDVGASCSPFLRDALFLGGSLSTYMSGDERVRAIRQYFPRATIDFIDGANHWPHFGATAADFSKRVCDWMSR
jgi:esterase